MATLVSKQHQACCVAFTAVLTRAIHVQHVCLLLQDLRALSKRVQFRGDRRPLQNTTSGSAAKSNQQHRHLLEDSETAVNQTVKDPTKDQQDRGDLLQLQRQQLEAGLSPVQQQSPAARDASQQAQRSDQQHPTDPQLGRQQQTSPEQQHQQQESQQQGSQHSAQLQSGQQQGAHAAGAGLATAGLTVEQAADKTQEHAMAAMMGGPPQWGGRFDNRSAAVWSHAEEFPVSCVLGTV